MKTRDCFARSRPTLLFCGWTGLLLLCSACHGPKSYLSVKEGPLLSYSRSMCFGPCPAFSLTVQVDGEAHYDGKANVKHVGEYAGHWPKSHLLALGRAAADVRLDQKTGTYDNPMVTDLPSTKLTFGGYQVLERINGPDLQHLYTVLDSLIEITTWAPESKPEQ